MRNRLFISLLRTKQSFCKSLKAQMNNVRTCPLNQAKGFSTGNKKQPDSNENALTSSHNLAGSISSDSYKIFDDEDAEVILDVTEQRETINLEDLKIQKEEHNPYKGLNLEHGTTGVFEIEDLVTLLQRDNAKDIFVASVPPELSYVNYMVVVTGKSQKHMKALAAFVRKVYKLKKHKNDFIPKIEGENSKEWIALDLGNIALHIFSKSARTIYDLETLWSVGPEFDDKTTDTDTVDIMEQYNSFLANFEPLENNNTCDEMQDSNQK